MKSSAPPRVTTATDLSQALSGVGCEKELRAALAAGDVAVFDMGRLELDGLAKKRQARAASESAPSAPSSPKPPAP